MNHAIVVAGGTGTRMGTDTPKQFLPLAGMPVMMHTLNAFHRSESSPQLLVVIHPSLRDEWFALCQKYRFSVPHTLTDGGENRFESVQKGLKKLQSLGIDLSESVIAVHDAARPLITPDLIDKTFEQARLTGSAALALGSTDSVRIKSSNGLKNNAYPREKVYRMQTPQTFRGDILIAAYDDANQTGTYTDDASVVESKGYPVTLIDGDTRNIKITFPEDLRIAEIFLEIPRA